MYVWLHVTNISIPEIVWSSWKFSVPSLSAYYVKIFYVIEKYPCQFHCNEFSTDFYLDHSVIYHSQTVIVLLSFFSESVYNQLQVRMHHDDGTTWVTLRPCYWTNKNFSN